MACPRHAHLYLKINQLAGAGLSAFSPGDHRELSAAIPHADSSNKSKNSKRRAIPQKYIF